MNKILFEALENNSRLIDNAIEDYYAQYLDVDTSEVRQAELYSLTAGGKRIRAFLVNEFCRAYGGSIEASTDFAVAVEMMHTFSLIHDDLPCMDDDDLRRGKPTSHKVFGEATALLAGDSLAIRALMTLANNQKVPKSAALDAVRVLSEAVCSEGMIGGQIIDMRGERETLDFDTLLKLHSKKTGALIIASAKLGCLAAGLSLDDERTKKAALYAEKIGLAFQIIDDILDVTADTETLGKSVGSDSESNKTTFLRFMSIEEARNYAARLTAEAQFAISDVQDAGVLCELAQYLLVRNK